MALHDVAKVAGVTEACRYNDHSVCNNPSCGCDCHSKAAIVQPNAEPSNDKACPRCGSKRPATETFCRIDGERLASLLCGVCGSGMNPEDNYCYGCGAPKGTTKVIKVPQLVVPSNDIEYEQQVLKGLQEELSVQQPEVGVSQTVVERPGGPQGSFKLVSQPSPNRLRTPASPQAGGSAGPRAIKLPIKPS